MPHSETPTATPDTMAFELEESHRMLKDLTARFVTDFLLPLEPAALQRAAAGAEDALTPAELARIDAAARELGLRGLDAPADLGGADPLAERQTIQWWVADGATRIHACRLMAYDAACRVDRKRDARTEISMLKVFATELAWDVVDKAMQTLGAMGMTRELPLHLMADRVRVMRIYDGPSEIHRWVVARNLLGLRR